MTKFTRVGSSTSYQYFKDVPINGYFMYSEELYLKLADDSGNDNLNAINFETSSGFLSHFDGEIPGIYIGVTLEEIIYRYV